MSYVTVDPEDENTAPLVCTIYLLPKRKLHVRSEEDCNDKDHIRFRGNYDA